MLAFALPYTLHVLAALVWVGGMFFAWLVLRPATVAALDGPARLRLWVEVFRRFFGWVWVAVAILAISGIGMLHMRFSGFETAPKYVQLMMGGAIVMFALFLRVQALLLPDLRAAVQAEDWPAGAAALGRIRRVVGINLIVGLVLVAIAAWSSAISLLEPMVAYLVERTKVSRAWVTFWLAFICWFVGLGTVFSFNIWKEAKFFVNEGGMFHLYQWGAQSGLDFFGVIDFFTSRIMLPLGGLCFVVFAGWVMNREAVRDELSIRSPVLFGLTLFLMRYVAPLGILVVFAAQFWK